MDQDIQSTLSQLYLCTSQELLLSKGIQALEQSGVFDHVSISVEKPSDQTLHGIPLVDPFWLLYQSKSEPQGDGLLLAKAFQSQFQACGYRQAKEHMEHFQELTHIGFWHWNVPNSKVFYSSQWKRMLGYEEHEIGNDFSIWETLLHPDDRAESERQVAFFFSNPELDNISEFRLKCKDGSYKTIISKGFVVKLDESNHDPEEIYGIHVAADSLNGSVEDHERLTLQLKRERTLRARAGEIADIGFWEVNIDTGHIYWNRKTREIHGVHEDYKPTIETAINFYKEGESIETISQAFEQCINEGKAYDVELILIDVHGQEKWVRAIGIRDETSADTRIFGLFQDIDQRKRAVHELEATKAELIASADRLSLATNSAQIGVWEYNIETGGLFWDQWMYLIYGIDEHDFPGNVSIWNQSLHPEDAELAGQALYDAINDIRPFNCQFRIIRPSGEVRHVKANAIVRRNEQGQAISMVGVNFDITEAYRASQAQEQARLAAEDSNRAKSDFLASMSHELRTPMNGVLGMLELMEGSVKQEINKRRLQIASNSAKNLLTILDDILDFSRIEAGKLELDYSVFSMNQLLYSLHDMFALEVEKKGSCITIESELEHDVFNGDQGRIRQMLINLIGNANKFTENGSITIRAKQGKNDMVQISVEDTGIGIPAERLDKIFESFTQADSSTTRKYGGSGLGLAICKHLSHLMNGNIDVVSEKGKGSTFSIYLPLEKAQQREQINYINALLPPIHSDQKMTLLLVEDNEINQIVLTDMLEDMNVAIEICNNGQEALSLLAQTDIQFDCILMDCQMPIMDGYVATQKIRAGEAGETFQHIPIIALTANAMTGDKEKCLAAGMNDYISKPVNMSALQQALSQYYKQD